MDPVSTFAIGEEDFLLDGRPHRVISGALHYFRIHPGLWVDRIRKARQMGLNTIETYVAWNLHAPTEDEWVADGALDLGAFLDLVAAEGMHAIVRPGPYICAEWTNGGLPVWLMRDPDMGLRRSEPRYLEAVSRYLEQVYRIVAPCQIDNGGPVILVQIENEYGAYGNDKDYLRHLVELTRQAGITVPLTTVDQPAGTMLEDGSLPELHKTGSFGSRAKERLEILRANQATGPLMCSEFWCGWFDWWGGVHHTTDAAASAAELDALLAAGASVNIYMVHGGTNFGLTSGANDKGRYLPIVTSYDYDAPIDEAGRPTEKYFAFRDVIGKYVDLPDDVPETPGPAPSFAVATEVLGDWTRAGEKSATSTDEPPTFDAYETAAALIRYETELDDSHFDQPQALLRCDEIRDQAWVYVDDQLVGTMSRTRQDNALVIPRGRSLSVLVEDQGRVNYDTRLGEPKGIIGAVTLGDQPLVGWRVHEVDPHVALGLSASDGGEVAHSLTGPVAVRGAFELDQPADLFLDTAGWGKGFAFVNGFFLGRYWRVGPQRTLYVPSSVTQSGENTVVIAELDWMTDPMVRFAPEPILGAVEE